MKKILVIDDDAMLLKAVKQTLQNHYLVHTAQSGKEAHSVATSEIPDLILLDLHLPLQNGFEIFRQIKDQPKTRDIPIIILTGDTDPENLIKGLDLGAVDYLRKPFHARELLARIQNRIKTSESTTAQPVRIRTVGNLTVDYDAHAVQVNGLPITLTEFELQLLTYLMDHAGKVVNRQKLLSVLWPDSVVSPRTVDTHVAHLRKKLKGFDQEIRTVHRAGYVISTQSQRVTTEGSTVSSAEVESTVESTVEA
jgi:two-component system alkaline phosphatase synthesis response regulator PhoP